MKRQLLKNVFLLPWVVCLSLLIAGTWVEMHAQSRNDASVAKQFIGTWRLVSWPQRLADGTMKQNSKSVGNLIYTSDGRMCYVGMNPNRPKWKSAIPTPEELAGLGINDFYAYCATVEIHAKEGYILHHVDIDTSPNWVERTRKRWFKFDGPNRVVLRIDPSENNPPVVESTLIWERVRDGSQ